MCLFNVFGGAVNPCLLVSPVIQKNCVERGSENADLSKFRTNLGKGSKILVLWKPADHYLSFM